MSSSDFKSIGKKGKWFRAYFLIVIAIIIVLLVYSAIILAQVRHTADDTNMRFATYYNTAMENSLKSLQDYSSTLLYSDTAKKMNKYNQKVTTSPEALDAAYDIVYDIRYFLIANGMLDDIYVYYPETDLIIGKKGIFPSYSYFKSENLSIRPLEEEYAQWKSLFDEKPFGYYTNTDTNDRQVVYYYLDALNGANSSGRRVIVAKISREKLNISFQDLISTSTYHYAALIDNQGLVYAQAGNSESFINSSGAFAYDSSDDRLIVCKVPSDIWPLTFVTVQDFNTAYKSVRITTNVLIIGTIIALLVGCALALFFSKKDQNAVDNLAKRFDIISPRNTKNDFDYIGTEIDKLIASNMNAIEAAEQQQKIIDSFFLKELLNKGNCTERDVENLCTAYQISFENPLFSLIIVKPKTELDQSKRDELQRIVLEHADDSFNIFCTNVSDNEVILCNYEACTKLPQAQVIELAKVLQNTYDYPVEISAVTDQSSKICELWKNLYREDRQSPVNSAIQKMMHQETAMLDEFFVSIDRDDLAAAIEQIPRLSQYLTSSSYTNLAVCRKYTLLSKLYEVYGSKKTQEQLDMLFHHINDSNWEKQLIAFLEMLDRDINRRVDMRQIAEMTKDAIHQEYSNPQLSLQMLADQMGVSQSYLSKLFKDKYGMSVIQYLNHVRVDQAKRLMVLSKDNLNVIAIKVGFTSNINLIRVFKKYENITPGDYRNKE